MTDRPDLPFDMVFGEDGLAPGTGQAAGAGSG